MSLLVWLPLNGDLHNQGLSDVTVNVSGATSWGDGKFGQALSGNNSTFWTVSALTLGENVSIAQWVKTSDSDAMFWVLVSDAYYPNYGSGNQNLWLSAGKYYLNIGDSRNNPFKDKNGNDVTAYQDNKWHHFVVTFDGVDCLLYIDGNYAGKSLQYRSPVTTNNSIKIAGGFRNSTPYALKGLVNDFRVYNHCLSPKEVKEIAKALILDYKLDDTLVDNTNILKGANFTWLPLTVETSYTKSGDTYIVTTGNFKQTYQFATSRMTIPLELLDSDDQYVVEFKYKVVSGDGLVDLNGCDWCDKVFVAKEETIVDDWHYVQLLCPVTAYTSQYHFMDFKWTQPNTVFEISNFQLYHSVSNNCDDCSGYRNNGVTVGEPLLDATNPIRYRYSTVFNSSQYVRTISKAKEFLPHDAITVNYWMYCTTWGINPISCTEGGGWNFEAGSNGLQFTVYNGASAGYKYAKSNITAASLLNNWHMITGTFDNENIKIYIDGVLKGSDTIGNTNGIGYNANNYLFIAAEAASGDTPRSSAFQGKLSDVRIYATALSADDVAELYNTAAVTDKQGNFLCYEAIEDGAASITKTGIAKFNIDERDRGSGVTIYSTVQPNLLLGTRRDNARYEVTGTTTEIGLRLTPAVQLQTNKKYTFSAMIRGFANMGLYTINSGGSAASPNERFDYISKSEMSAQDFKLFSVTFKVTKDVASIDQIYPCTKYGPANTQVGDWFEIQADSIKLEEGEMCTPWIPDATDNEYRSYDNLLSTTQLIEI